MPSGYVQNFRFLYCFAPDWICLVTWTCTGILVLFLLILSNFVSRCDCYLACIFFSVFFFAVDIALTQMVFSYSVKNLIDYEQITLHIMGWLSKIFKGSSHKISEERCHDNNGEDTDSHEPSCSGVITSNPSWYYGKWSLCWTRVSF